MDIHMQLLVVSILFVLVTGIWLDNQCSSSVLCNADFVKPGIYKFREHNSVVQRLHFNRFPNSRLDISNLKFLELIVIKYDTDLKDDACNMIKGNDGCVSIVIGSQPIVTCPKKCEDHSTDHTIASNTPTASTPTTSTPVTSAPVTPTSTKTTTTTEKSDINNLTRSSQETLITSPDTTAPSSLNHGLLSSITINIIAFIIIIILIIICICKRRGGKRPLDIEMTTTQQRGFHLSRISMHSISEDSSEIELAIQPSRCLGKSSIKTD